ncbi:penicillin acylase family protein [Acetobacter persici]|uniref:penicillin acylase family protein n=1 Tax=Acetobacter persici TaxID=1076596 RepID=UPI0039EC0A02
MKQSASALSRRRVLLGGVAAGLAGFVAPSALARKGGNSRIMEGEGLEAPVEVLEDQWGVPHVRAASVPDAFFANGYLVARDRLWQLDFEYRRALGRLAEVFGPDFVPSDTASRLFLFRGDAQAEFAALPPTVQASARAYVAGINAYLTYLKKNEEQYPEEFRIFSYTPLVWDVLDLVRMRAEATGNTQAEVRRARLAAQDALAYDALIMPLRPAHTLTVPDGLDVQVVTEQDLGLFGVLQDGPPLSGLHIPPSRTEGDHRRANEGSNAWVIAPTRTATGRPVLANDPHLSFGSPGPRHVIHLTAPGLDVIGGGAPGMPGVMQGHNAHFAFGRTNFHIDQEDLFILRTHPDHPDRYFHNGRWVEMETEETTIAVRGGPAQRVRLRYAAQGPVVSADGVRNRAVAVSATWLYPGANGMLANIGINLASDWPSFRKALKLHTSPTNFTYADTYGNIGWQAAGGLPERRNGYDGLLPAPGDGRYDWKGLQPLDALPNSFNPACGWFGTSNELNLPADYPYAERCVSYEWKDPYRYQRVAEVLQASPRATLAQSVALQHDTLSHLALSVVQFLPDVPAHLASEATLLRRWDGHVEAASAGAALYEVWWTRLNALFYQALVPAHLRSLLPQPLNASVLLALLQAPDERLGTAPEAQRNTLLVTAFQQAVDELRDRLGPVAAAWQWGRLHTVQLRHPLHSVKAVAEAFLPIGGEDARSGGDAYTVMARWYNLNLSHRALEQGRNPYAVTGGASYLMVCDVGAWDHSLFLNFPGQSALPGSGHYEDALRVWLKGEMQPLLFSEPAVQAGARYRSTLYPKGKTP